MKKIANSCIWGHILRAVFKNGGSADRPKMDKFENFQSFIAQNPNWMGDSLMKKMPTLVFWAPYCGPFWTYWGGLPIGPQLTDLKNFELFSTQNRNSKGVCFMKKIANSCIWGHILRAVLKNGGSADRPRIGRLKKFSTFFHTKSEFRGGLFYEKMC